jgi:Adenylate cyclase, family 3 (some proteins contain HAMP domain)
LSDENPRLSIVVGGDCSILLRALGRAVGGVELRIHAVSSAAELIARLDELSPDLVFVDADCERPLGLEMCRAVKEHPTTMLVPVVAMSRSSERRLAALAAGADDFVTPHVRRDVFRARVETLARTGAARRKIAAAQLTAEKEQREQIRRMFRRYVSPRIADKILADAELRDQLVTQPDLRTHAVVMFADMRGFTCISERLSPSAVVPLLNEYFSLLTEIAFRHDGTVFHMAGDCLMVGFGVPMPQPDGPERAIRAAREMLASFGQLAQAWKDRYQIETGLGIGIHAGDVVAGNVGSPAYMSYTIIGDTVNVASRLCQRARAGEILFSRALKDLLDARGVELGVLELPPMTLRGRTAPIDIYCVPLERRLEIAS